MNAVTQPEAQAVATASAVAQYKVAKVAVPAAELRALLDRALNTMDPNKWPQWCHDILGGGIHPIPKGGLIEGVRATDECTFQFRRAVTVEEIPSADR